MSSYDFFEIERHEHVATMWLAQPESRNAMAPTFWKDLPNVMEELATDESVRAIVLAARGKHFTVGLDLKSIGVGIADGEGSQGAGGRKRLLDDIFGFQKAITTVADCEKPVIAATHGYCLGGGIDLITACDVRVASTDTRFGIRETRMAMVADVGTLQRLPGIIGKGLVAELALTGDDFDAARAKEMGLVNEVYPDAAATVDGAQAMAARMAANSPLAVTGTKRVLKFCEGKSIDDGLTYVATWNAAFVASDDLREAMRAFLEKRKPEFSGR